MKKNGVKRGILIGLICVFTLLLVGELALVCLYPAGNGQAEAFPGASGTEKTDRRGSFSMQEGEMPSGDFTMPEGGVPSGDFSMPEGGMTPPGAEGEAGDAVMMERPDTVEAGNSGSGILGALRGAWIPIVVVCLLGDAVCILLLVRLKKKEGKETPASDMPELEPDFDNLPRVSRTPFYVAVIAVVLTLALILSSLPSGSTGTETEVNTRVMSAQPETASISTVLSGAGILTSSEAAAAEIPGSVSIAAYHVKNGDMVAEGDILASVDRVETASAIAELQGLLEDLDEDLNTEKAKTANTSVEAPAAGRVKAIYAQAGDSTADVMYEYGALMLLSLDGLMAVDIPAGDLKAGDSVTVLLSDGTSQTGRVAQILDGTATATTADDTAPYGDSVTVTDEDGGKLGNGILYIHSQLKVTGFSGTVSRIQTALNRQVTAGTQVMTLTDTGYTFEYYRLLARRQELEETMDALVKLNRDGFLRAEQAGQVSGIPEDGDYVALSAGEKAQAASGLTARESVTLVLLSDIKDGAPEKNPDAPQEPSVTSVTYPASVSAISGNAMILNITSAPVDLSVMDAQTALSTLPVQAISYTYDGSTPITDSDGNSLTVEDLSTGDVLVFTVSMDDSGTISIISILRAVSAQPEMPGEPSHGGGAPGGTEQGGTEQGGSGTVTIPGGSSAANRVTIPGGQGGYGTESSQEEYDTYSTEMTQVLTITPQEEMTISIQVDELDILSLTTGLEAKITLDALEGQSFSGTVTSIALEGENQGGNTKFAVEVTVPKEETMLPGMNASVKITTAVSEPVTTIPAAALVEEGGRTCVYLGYDEKTDTLTDLTQVETGLSDGDRVQILSGVPEDATVYYRYADTVVYSFTNG